MNSRSRFWISIAVFARSAGRGHNLAMARVWLGASLALALSVSACFPSSVDLAGKRCDAQGRCADGYACVADTCTKQGLAGTPCVGAADCADGLACRSGVCGPPCVAPGCECDPGQTQPCGSALGICVQGVQTCGQDEHWGGCVGGVRAVTETCDGEDDDCDGVADDGPAMVCVQGADEGPCVTTCGTDGRLRCNATCTDYTACQPPAEVCNGQDDDCDGAVDDGPDMVCARGADAGSCTTSCHTAGHKTCNDSCSGYQCAGREVCNGLDDDCDGVPDNGLGTAAQRVAGPGPLQGLALAVGPRAAVAIFTRRDTSIESVAWQVLDANLEPVGAPTEHNATTAQTSPAALALPGGGFTVAWIEGGAVLSVRLDADGAAVTSAGQVSRPGEQVTSFALAAGADGGARYLLQRREVDGGSTLVLEPVDGVTGPWVGTDPAVATRSDGGLGIAYRSASHLMFSSGADGAPLPMAAPVSAPSIAYDDPSGSFVIAWANAPAGGSTPIECANAETAAPVQIATSQASQPSPRVAAGNGYVYAAWRDDADGGSVVRMARIDAHCAVAAGPRTVATSAAELVLAAGGAGFTLGFDPSSALADGGAGATLSAQDFCF